MTDSPPPNPPPTIPAPPPGPAVPAPAAPATSAAKAAPAPTPAAPAKPVTSAPPAAAARPPRTGHVQDRGVSRRDSVVALTWSADGTVKVTGDVDVGSGKFSGQLSVGGAITADAFAVHGALDSGGPVSVLGRFSTDGSLHAVGPVQAKEASFSGTTRIGRDVVVERLLTVKGQFAAPSLRVGELRGDGSVDVPGSTDAGEIDVRIRRDSRFGAIRARTVRLIRVPPNPIERLFGRSPPSTVARIEADKVELEGVDVAFVRCPEVVLGRDAHVTEVEGTIVRRHSTARVGPRSKTPPPYGLSR